MSKDSCEANGACGSGRVALLWPCGCPRCEECAACLSFQSAPSALSSEQPRLNGLNCHHCVEESNGDGLLVPTCRCLSNVSQFSGTS